MLLASLLASQVWLVEELGFGDFVDIQPAVDAAADGDAIVVWQGNYGSFEIVGKSLTIVGWHATTPFVRADGDNGDPTLRISDLGPTQRVHVRNLRVEPATFPTDDTETVISLQNNAGAVVFEELLSFGSGSPDVTVSAVQAVASDSVAFLRCTLQAPVPDEGDDAPAGGAGVEAYQSNLHFYDSFVRGAEGSFSWFEDGGPGGDGCVMGQGFLFAVNTELRGGHGGSPQIFSGSYGLGGAGLSLGVGVDAWLGSNAYFGGFGDPDGPGFAAHGLATYTEFTHDPRTFETSSPHEAGESTHMVFGGPAGEATVTFVSPTPLGFALADPFGFVLPWTPLIPISTGVIPASGTLELDASVGSIGTSAFRELYLQPVFIDALLTLRLGTPSMLLIHEPL